MSGHDGILICNADALIDGGKGFRFPLEAGGAAGSGFIVRFRGKVYGYLNRCAHVPIELDWAEGEFFESTGLYLMCATHGAIYAPETGRCEGGPCRGGKLRPIRISEIGNQLFWHPDSFLTVSNQPIFWKKSNDE